MKCSQGEGTARTEAARNSQVGSDCTSIPAPAMLGEACCPESMEQIMEDIHYQAVGFAELQGRLTWASHSPMWGGWWCKQTREVSGCLLLEPSGFLLPNGGKA